MTDPGRQPDRFKRDAGFRRVRGVTSGITVAAIAGSLGLAGVAYADTHAARASGTGVGSTGGTGSSSDGSGTGSSNDNTGGGLVGPSDRAPHATSGGS